MQIQEDFSFLAQKDWQAQLGEHLNTENETFFTEQLLPVEADGIGYCVDERPKMNVPEMQDYKRKAAFVGGAAGWVALYMGFGQSQDEAFASTRKMYESLGWGNLEFHIDNEHGHIHDAEELANRNSGCGFLGVATQVFADMKELFGNSYAGLQTPEIDGSSVISTARNAGDVIVPLEGDHKTANYEARVVVNTHDGMTLDRDALYAENPAFLWDAWATVNPKVLAVFNEISGENLSHEEFYRLQAALHLITCARLNALNLGEKSNNLVMLTPGTMR
ncbi:hypothetical protein LRY65_00445 [Candidatus Woesebacteria bacterium]|nr:hypothetical protein [Candidatus Woesebacteria bacterium]MCD8526671.1 hypothetical protein [Candidatus Woesebacteria bacterium]MCD8546696.1 hypothetical protein [Candidatus Woesebacteria bacterium]